MKVVGLITEYNPFHNGHKYHIEEAKRITGADYAIVVMSGNFVQRGVPAIIDKYSRTKMALQNGADIIFELPVCYATGSAEFFALGAVSLLEKLGIVDYLCFGSECGDIELIKEIANLLISKNEAIENALSAYMKEGFTYPAARLKAIEQYFISENQMANHQALSQVLSAPNNILGIEYLKALLCLSGRMIPVTIKRQLAHYHDPILSNTNSSSLCKESFDTTVSNDNENVSSATAIRAAIHDTNKIEMLSMVKSSVPNNVYDLLVNNYQVSYPISEEDFSQIIKYKLLSEDNISLTRYVDITKDLADRMNNIKDWNVSIAILSKGIKTKNITLTRINRALIHLSLNIYNDNFQVYNQNGYTQYARVLGIKEASSHLLRQITKKGRIPIITKVSKANKQLDSIGMQMLSEDLFASHLYHQIVYDKYGTCIPNEYMHGIIII